MISDSSFRLYFCIHLWLKASSEVNLMSACLHKRLEIKSLASSLIDCQTVAEKSKLPWSTLCKISLLFLPPKGGLPLSMMNITTPIDQLSHWVV